MGESESLYNWTHQMELYCISSFKMGLFGSAYFAGYFFGALCFLRFADLYGRRRFVLVGTFFVLVSYLLLVFINSQTLRYLMLFALGTATAV